MEYHRQNPSAALGIGLGHTDSYLAYFVVVVIGSAGLVAVRRYYTVIDSAVSVVADTRLVDVHPADGPRSGSYPTSAFPR